MSAASNLVLTAHVAGGSIALVSGTLAILTRKGGSIHALAGNWFVGSMLLEKR